MKVFSIRYSCDQYEYFVTLLSNLKRYKESKHEGIRYSCDKCRYFATLVSNLKQDKEAKHEGIR